MEPSQSTATPATQTAPTFDSPADAVTAEPSQIGSPSSTTSPVTSAPTSPSPTPMAENRAPTIPEEPVVIKHESSSIPPKMPMTGPRPATLPPTPPHELPTRALVFGVVAIAVLILTTLGAFLYIQNRGLKNQISTIQRIESGREVPSTTPTEIVVSPTPEVATDGAFFELPNILPTALQESATAQLLMVTTDISIPSGKDMTKAARGTFQYWFRQGPGLATYFQVVKAPDSAPTVVKPAFVNPDNNIPDLLPLYQAKTLGIDVFQANAIAWNQVVNFTGTSTPINISAKYIRSMPTSGSTSEVNIWQVTYKFDPASAVTDKVVQIDANSQQILYVNTPKPTSGNSPS